MIELGAETQYIAGAYLGVLLVTAGIVLWTLRDARGQKKRLADLEARGIRRRSAGSDGVKSDGAA